MFEFLLGAWVGTAIGFLVAGFLAVSAHDRRKDEVVQTLIDIRDDEVRDNVKDAYDHAAHLVAKWY